MDVEGEVEVRWVWTVLDCGRRGKRGRKSYIEEQSQSQEGQVDTHADVGVPVWHLWQVSWL